MVILICGHRAYAARGLKAHLEQEGHQVLEFSRGEVMRKDNIIYGPVLEIDNNPMISEYIDVVINFIILQNDSIDHNEQYIHALLSFCQKRGVKSLIQISSISSYPNETLLINEDTPIDQKTEYKGPYGKIKAVVDQKLEKEKNKFSYEIVFVRPGYIVANDNPYPFKGIAKLFGNKFAILIGDKNASLPCIRRDVFHNCLAEIITQKNPLPVYLLVEGGVGTKYSYFRSQSKAMVLPLPKRLLFFAADVAKSLHLLTERQVRMVKGAFKVNKIDNSLTKIRLKSLF